MDDISHLSMVNEVLIKPGSADICPITGGDHLVLDCSDRSYSPISDHREWENVHFTEPTGISDTFIAHLLYICIHTCIMFKGQTLHVIKHAPTHMLQTTLKTTALVAGLFGTYICNTHGDIKSLMAEMSETFVLINSQEVDGTANTFIKVYAPTNEHSDKLYVLVNKAININFMSIQINPLILISFPNKWIH